MGNRSGRIISASGLPVTMWSGACVSSDLFPLKAIAPEQQVFVCRYCNTTYTVNDKGRCPYCGAPSK